MPPPEPSYSISASPKYCNTAETQEKDLKTNLMKIIELHKEEINKSLKEIKEG